MEYQESTVQRVFSIRFAKGDRIIEGLERLIKEKEIRAGTILFLGAFSKGSVVLGLRRYYRAPTDFNRTSFRDAQDVVGAGSIHWEEDRPKVLLQGGIGKEREVFIARIEEADVSGVEAVIFEFGGPGFKTAVLARDGSPP